METLFSELPIAARFFIAFLVVLLLIVLAFWLIRRLGGMGLGTSAVRGRQPRLAVIDAAPVDGRRRLVLIRRDNVEHLLMIGGPSDIVVEQNIVRAVPVASAREVFPARAPGALAEAMARAAEPEREMPAPPVPLEPAARVVERAPPRAGDATPHPAPRPMREGPTRTLPPVERLGRMGEGEMPLRAAPPIMPAASHVPQAQKPAPEPAASAESRPAPPASDAALTDMAQRLEAALRRPMTAPQGPPQARSEPAKAEPAPPPRPAGPFGAPPPAPSAKPAPKPDHAPEPAQPAQAEQKPASGKSMLDSLEQEMASLLGRPIGKE
jgi:flagellar biogenesis protein FliO